MKYRIFVSFYASVVVILLHSYITKPFFTYYNIPNSNIFQIGWWEHFILLTIITILSYRLIDTIYDKYFKN
jgi:hypothetical protein